MSQVTGSNWLLCFTVGYIIGGIGSDSEYGGEVKLVVQRKVDNRTYLF